MLIRKKPHTQQISRFTCISQSSLMCLHGKLGRLQGQMTFTSQMLFLMPKQQY